jgi:hypothetical protein
LNIVQLRAVLLYVQELSVCWTSGESQVLLDDPYLFGVFSVSRVINEAAANMKDDEATLIRLAQQGNA